MLTWPYHANENLTGNEDAKALKMGESGSARIAHDIGLAAGS